LLGVGLDWTRNLAAGVFSNGTTTADTLNLYELSNLASPALLAQADFPTLPRVANGNRISETFFKNDLLFTFEANNGLMVFRILPPPGIVRLTGFMKLPSGTFQFGYSNSDGRTYRVFASTNLADWSAIGTATQTSPGLFQFTDLQATNIPRRFYQLRSP
jgi:hypothetical protein